MLSIRLVADSKSKDEWG